MEEFNPDLLLSQEMSIDSVDEHLYRIGLCLTPNRHNTRRSLIFHPILITIVTIIFTIMRIASIFTDQRWLLLLLCDIGQLFGMKIYINLGLISVCLFILWSQLIYYYNNNLYIRPTFLTLFHVMSGSVSPNSIGLNDEQQVKKLLSLSRKLFFIVKYQCQYIVPIIYVVMTMSTYFMSTSLIEVILYGIPTTIMITLIAFWFWNIFCYQYVYYFLVCKYLDIKVNNSNEKLVLMRKQKNSLKLKISEILCKYNAIYCEIKEYDSTYLSKFLFTIWILLGTLLVILVYFDIFSKINLFIRLIFYYCTLSFIYLFIFTITTAASINYDNKKTYKLLNTFYIFMINRKKYYHDEKLIRFKVSNENKNSNEFYNYFQLSQFIERVAKRRVGFTLWSIIIIDYFRCYGVMYFLKTQIIIIISIVINIFIPTSHQFNQAGISLSLNS